ncbi:MAG: hypothetical protein RL490_558 [Pseudomonadota bacterium]|jgi:proline iminopeptidase
MMHRRAVLTLGGAALLAPWVASADGAAPGFAPHVARFGTVGAPPLLFLHGGPGSNGYSFEATAAAAVAARGYRVISFDQRGCGRSQPAPAGSRFTFAEAVADIDAVRSAEKLGQVTLVGHSFGGILALHYAAAHPEMVSRVVMVSTPLDFAATLRTIRRNARARYGSANPQGVAYLDMIDKMDPASTDYAGYTFAHGIASGLYMAPALPPEAQARYRAALASPQAALLSDAAQAPFVGFVASEAYTTRNFAPLAKTVAGKTPCQALCGAEDGLFDTAEFDRIRAAIGAARLTVVPGASHLVFADQQPAFLDALGPAKPVA